MLKGRNGEDSETVRLPYEVSIELGCHHVVSNCHFFDKTLPIFLLTAYLLSLVGDRSAGVHRCRRGVFLLFIIRISVQFQISHLVCVNSIDIFMYYICLL